MKRKIFISYRRDDTHAAVTWLYEKLKDRFGENIIFMDNGTLEPGEIWPTEIENSLKESEIVLVVIGAGWLTKGIDQFGLRRIENENDWVRKEIEMALMLNKIIQPILIDGAKMPPLTALPASIHLISNTQAHELTVTAGANSGIDALLASLSKTLDKDKEFDPLKESLEKVLVEKYKLIKEIGSGVVTKVYQAHDHFLDRDVAIKVLQDITHKDSFIGTIRNAAKMVEYVPNSVQILGAWTDRDPIHVILSYLQGGTLREKVNETEGGGLSLTEVHRQLVEVGEALVKAHKAGITHCNVKPSNIILSSNGEPYLSSMCSLPKVSVKAILNKFLPENIDPQKSTYRENICYLPPEIFEANYFGISEKDKYEKMDQYMLGLVGYDLLTGRIPDTVSTHNELKTEGIKAFKSLDKIGNIRKECPGKLQDIIHKMISLDPNDRYPTIEDAVKDLKNISFDAIEIAKDSYARCISGDIPNNEFFKVFYSELIRLSTEAAERFKGKGVGEESKHRQYEMLREAIFILFWFAEKKLGTSEPNILSRIAASHNKTHYNISGPTYDHFVKALTNTVCGAPPTVPVGFDQHCSNSNERIRIRKAWEEALAPGIEYMKKRYWDG